MRNPDPNLQKQAIRRMLREYMDNGTLLVLMLQGVLALYVAWVCWKSDDETFRLVLGIAATLYFAVVLIAEGLLWSVRYERIRTELEEPGRGKA